MGDYNQAARANHSQRSPKCVVCLNQPFPHTKCGTCGLEGYSYVPSTADTRVVNNAVRHQYRVLTDTEKAIMLSIKDKGQQFIDALTTLRGEAHMESPKREYSLAITKIEEAVMWAVKGLTA